jgi:hypothetical protein
MAIGHAPAIHLLLPLRGSQRTRDEVIGVSRMNDVITISVENDGGDKRLPLFGNVQSFTRGGSALSHGGERRNKIVGGSTSQT